MWTVSACKRLTHVLAFIPDGVQTSSLTAGVRLMDNIAFGVAAVLFLTFVANVAAGAFAGASFLGDVAEMLLLFAAVLAFTVGALKREAEAESKAE